MHTNCDKKITNSVGFSTSRSERDKIRKKFMLYYSSDNMYMNNNTILFCCIVTLFLQTRAKHTFFCLQYVFLQTFLLNEEIKIILAVSSQTPTHRPTCLKVAMLTNQPAQPARERERELVVATPPKTTSNYTTNGGGGGWCGGGGEETN